MQSMRLSYVFESRNGLNMDYISIKCVFGNPHVDTSISCCHYFYTRFPKPIDFENQESCCLGYYFTCIQSMRLSYVFESSGFQLRPMSKPKISTKYTNRSVSCILYISLTSAFSICADMVI